MAYPLPKGLLQELYPGRLIPKWGYHFTGDDIPPAHNARLTQMELALLSKDAALDEEAMNRKLGGINPVYDRTSIEPENPVEMVDPIVITSNNLGTRGQSDIEIRPAMLDSVGALHQKGGRDSRLIDKLDQRLSNQNYVNDKNYDWSCVPGTMKECYEPNGVGTNAILGNAPVTGQGINTVFFILLIGFVILLLFVGGWRLSPRLKLF